MGIAATTNANPSILFVLKSTLGRVMAMLALFAAYVLVASAGYSGFFLKWAFRDGPSSQVSYLSIRDGTAIRPWAYRQLLPLTVNVLVSAIPAEKEQALQEKWLKHNLGDIYMLATDARIPAVAVNYRFAFLLTFCSFLGALFGLRSLCFRATRSRTAATAAPMLFALLYPILMTRGGYFYDPIELLMFVLAILFTVNGWWVGLIVLAPLAELNKEAFFFFLFTLIPLVPPGVAKSKSYWALAISGVLALCTYAIVSHTFAQNPGGSVEFHLLDNLWFYAQPSSYVSFEHTYGIPLPRGVSLFNLAIVGSLVAWGWSRFPREWRRHAYIALAINLPLFILFCWRDELRNLSMVFVSMTVLMACALKTFVEQDAALRLTEVLGPDS